MLACDPCSSTSKTCSIWRCLYRRLNYAIIPASMGCSFEVVFGGRNKTVTLFRSIFGQCAPCIVEEEDDVAFLSAHVVAKLTQPLSKKDGCHPLLEVAAIGEAKLTPYLLLETALLLRVTNGRMIAFVQGVSVVVTQVLIFYDPSNCCWAMILSVRISKIVPSRPCCIWQQAVHLIGDPGWLRAARVPPPS